MLKRSLALLNALWASVQPLDEAGCPLPQLTLYFDVPTVALNDAVTDGQPEARSFTGLFGREEGVEKF